MLKVSVTTDSKPHGSTRMGFGRCTKIIAPACCKAFVAIDTGCFHIMFPWNPFFPQLLNVFCARIEGSARGVPPSPPVSARVLGTYRRCSCITY
ncbi:hypothetical protein WN943_002614 [Citrus x changshan-huyou]